MCNKFNKKFLDEAAKAQSENENLSEREHRKMKSEQLNREDTVKEFKR